MSEGNLMVFEIPAAEPSSAELAKECSRAADNAVEWVRTMSGIELDYSPPSLMALDRILEALIPALSQDDEEPTVAMLGSYLGEVFLRTCGGRWETGDMFTGPALRGLGGKEITISPFSRIRQAFARLEAHHLATYWNSVMDRLDQSQPLDDRSGFRPPPEESLKRLPVTDTRANSGADGPTDEELAKQIPEETKQFVKILKSDLGVELDYSLDSLRFLDHYLRSLHETMKKEGKMGEKRVFVYLAGNYLGEVIRKAYGGRWIYVPEQETAGLMLQEGRKDSTVYPHKAAAKMAMEYESGSVLTYADKIKQRLSAR
jgi:hypothetical protein